jgi:CRP-like cAMP-binding protein
MRGRLEASVGNEVVKKYMAGMYFGELVLLKGSPGVRAATVRAHGAATVLSLDRGSFHRLLGEAEPFLLDKADRYKSEKTPKTVRHARFEDNPVSLKIDRYV